MTNFQDCSIGIPTGRIGLQVAWDQLFDEQSFIFVRLGAYPYENGFANVQKHNIIFIQIILIKAEDLFNLLEKYGNEDEIELKMYGNPTFRFPVALEQWNKRGSWF